MAKFSRISKSQYLKGLQCPKMLWLYRHRPDLAPEISEGQQYIFDTGTEVGILAQKCFEGGLEIAEPYYKIDQAIVSTQKAVNDGQMCIFEATACSDDGAFSRIDVLKKVEGSDDWDLIEVKSSSEVKDYYYDDIALQRYAFSKAGYKIRKSKLMHIDSDYVRSGDLDPEKLFRIEDCTDLITDRMTEVKITVRDLLAVLNSKKEPEVEIGNHCKDPFDCDYKPYCWQDIPEYSVYNVFRGRKREELLSQDIVEISSVPDNFELTDRQHTDVSAFKTNEIYCDRAAIREFLEQLEYPLYFLDYEAIWPAVPLFDKASPYQQIPFQFSLHIQKKKGGEPEHLEFLHTELSDPRPEFIKELVAKCGDKGSVVVYNQGYESRINNELGHDFPQFKSDLESINDRMVDLLIPFRSRYLYHPEMKGSASLKSVLPAFVPEMSYDNFEISDGEMASIRYLSCIKNLISDEEKQKIFSNLKKYCCQDTLAEVELLKVLYEYAD
jgi:DNA-directed RNA polymerase subunit N (RpoN/RPB10)